MEPIRRGDAGPAVTDVQERLAAAGMPVDDLPGRFGAATEAAVRRFQQLRRLVADGAIGADTWASLVDAGYRFGDRLLYTTEPPLRGDDVLELQQRLGRLGFDAGSLDGIHGPATAAAVRDFQHNCGVPVDGIVGPATLARLDSLHRDHQSATGVEVLDRVVPHARPLAGARFLVDPAHGPADPGVRGAGTDEASVVWDIANRVVGQLVAIGASPALSRGRHDTPTTSQRAATANALDVDAIVSLRCAGLDEPSARGVAAYYFGSERGQSEQGRQLAEHLVAHVSAELGTPNCRTHQTTTAILRESKAPAVLVEVGFLTSPHEGAALADPAYRHHMALAIVAALAAWTTGAPEVGAAGPHAVPA